MQLLLALIRVRREPHAHTSISTFYPNFLSHIADEEEADNRSDEEEAAKRAEEAPPNLNKRRAVTGALKMSKTIC